MPSAMAKLNSPSVRDKFWSLPRSSAGGGRKKRPKVREIRRLSVSISDVLHKRGAFNACINRRGIENAEVCKSALISLAISTLLVSGSSSRANGTTSLQ